MTNSSIATRKFVGGAAKSPRTGNTLRLHLLMEAAQKLEIGGRITELRERSPFTQPEIAEQLGIGLRAYQKVEQKGTEDFERCQALYEIHKDWAAEDSEWAHVSAGWIWDGKVRVGASPLDALSAREPLEVDRLTKVVAEQAKAQTRLSGELAAERTAREEMLTRIERLERGLGGAGLLPPS